VNTKLRQHLVSTDELRGTNMKLEKSVEAAQIMMGKLQSESQARVESLTETLVSKDAEIARLQTEAANVRDQLKKQMESTDEKLEKSVEAAQSMIGKLQTESQARVDSVTQSLVSKDVEIAKLQAEAESVKSQLGRQGESTDELRETNLQMQKSVEAAQIMMNRVRTESQNRVGSLNESLVTRDVEIAKLQAEFKVMSESKDTEMNMLKKMLETQEEEAKKLRLESKTSSESLVAQEAALTHLRTEFETLQAAFDAIKAEKEEIEQGHEDAKEKWKRLVITMKSEYDNFRASFDHLKASKKEMEETYSAEKNALALEVSKLRTENGSVTAAMDSLKICKEVSDNQYKEGARSWDNTKKQLEDAVDKAKQQQEEGTSQVRQQLEEENRRIRAAKEQETAHLKKQMEEEAAHLKKQLEEETLRLKRQQEEESTRAKTQLHEETTRLKTQLNEETTNLKTQLAYVRTDNETLSRNNRELECNWSELNSAMEIRVREQVEPTEKKFASIVEEYGQVKSEMYSLQLAKQDVEMECKEIKEHFEDLIDQREGFKKELRMEVVEHTILRENHEDLTGAHEVKVVECETLKTEVECLEKAKEELNKTLADLQVDHEAINNEFDTLKEEVVTLKAEHTENFEALQAAHEELLKEKAGAEEKIATMESDNEEMSEAYARTAADLEDITAKLEMVQEEKAEVEKAFKLKVEESLETEKDLLGKIATIEEEKAAGEKQLKQQEAEAEKQLKEQKTEADRELKDHQAEAEKQIFGLKHELEALEADLKASKSAMEGAKIVSKDEKHKLENKIAKLHKTVKTKKEALSLGLGKYLKELKAKERAEKEIGQLRTKLDENDEAIKKYTADLEGAEKRIVALEDVIKFKDTDHKKATVKLNSKAEESLNYEATQREAALEAQIQAENKLAEMDKLVKKTESEILAAKCRGDSIREEFEKAEAGRKEAIENIESLTEKMKETESSLQEKLKETESSLQEKLKETESTLEERDSELHSLRGDLAIVEQGKKTAKEELEMSRRRAKEELEFARKRSKQEADEMKQQINSLNKMVAKKITAINALESKCETLKNSVDVSDTTATDVVKKVDFLHQMIHSKEKELDLIKSRCSSLQTSLDETEEELSKKVMLQKQLDETNSKVAESRMLVEKKNKELQAIQERCDKLQASLKKAESLYVDGVETIKTEAERQQREALEEATDRAYVLKGMLAKKEEELAALKESCEKLKSRTRDDSSENNETNSEAEAKATEDFKTLINKIDFLDGMVASKDSELQLVKTRCEGLQASITKMQEAHGKHVSLIRDEAEKNVTNEQMEKEAEIRALNREIARKQSKLRSLKDGDEFEIILDNGDDHDEVEALKARCNDLEKELEKSQQKSTTLESAMKVDDSQEQWKTRVDELQASLDKMTKQYQEESDRRKEAEQVFATLTQKPSNEKSDESAKPESSKPETSKATTRGVFGRSKITTDNSDVKPSRWLSLRGRKKKEELTVRPSIDTREEAEQATRTASPTRVGSPTRAGSPSKWRSQYSPRRRAPDATTLATRAKATTEGASGEKERILAQIPAHIKSNFYEVGIYKQRLQNSYLPVLCLSPYDVPPGPVRDEWLSKFDGKSKVLNLGVYFLGKGGKDEGAYGTIPWFSFVPYSKAVQRGLDVVPKDIAKKIEAGEELTDVEKQVRDGMKALKEAGTKSKAERTHPLRRLAQASGNIPTCIVTESVSVEDQVSEMGY